MSALTEAIEQAAAEQEAERQKPDWGNLPPPLRFTELEANPPPEPPQLIDGLLRREEKLLLTANSKGRKTWTLLHLGLAVSEGVNWLGFPTVKTGVLYLNLELHPWAMMRRESDVKRATGIRRADNFWVQNLRGTGASLRDLWEPLPKFCRDAEIGFLILDPFYKIGEGADELSTSQIGAFLMNLETLAKGTGAAIAIAHHHTKGDSSQKSVIDLASGTGVFARDPDSIIGIRELRDSTDEQPLARMDFVLRNAKPQPSIGLRWDFPIWRPDATLDLELKGQGKPGRPRETSVADILEIIGDRELSAGEWELECCDKIGIGARTFKELKASALREGRIEQRRDGRKTIIRRTRGTNSCTVSPAEQAQFQGLGQ